MSIGEVFAITLAISVPALFLALGPTIAPDHSPVPQIKPVVVWASPLPQAR